jgi:hypothetical protein
MKKLCIFALCLSAAVFLAPNEGQSQGGPKGQKGEQPTLQPGSNQSARSIDPMELFDRISGGKQYLTPQDIAGLDSLKSDFQTLLGAAGNATSQLTREQFHALIELRKEQQRLQREYLRQQLEWQREQLLAGNDVFPIVGMPAGLPGGHPAGGAGQGQPKQPDAERLAKEQRKQQEQLQQQQQQQQQQMQALDAELEAAFRAHRLNKDGYMTKDSSSPQLRAQWDIWDFDANGLIDATEYKAYKMAERIGWNPSKGPNPFRPSWAVEPHEPVYRKGKLPNGLPTWFPEISSGNEEPQIFLFDWRTAGKRDEEFAAMDRNGDGILTPDEVLYFIEQERNTKFASKDIVALPDPGQLTAYGGQPGTKVAFTVTGRADGGIWGTGTYTLDSLLASAAVHAGVLKVGETGIVLVEIIPDPGSFMGSSQHGVNSGQWANFPQGAYRFLDLSKADKKKGSKGSGSGSWKPRERDKQPPPG